MKQFALFSLALLIISCNKKENEKEVITIATNPIPSYQKNYKTLNVYGKVKSIICFNYEQYVQNTDLDYFRTKTDYKFDEKGNVSEEKVYLENEILQYKNQYFYDNFGNCLKTKSFEKDSSLNYTNIIQLNKKGLLVSDKTINSTGTEEYITTYNKITDTILVYSFYKTSNPKDISKVYEKYKNGKIVYQKYVNGKISWENKFEYDSCNNKVMQSNISKFDNRVWKWRYDKNNRAVFWQVHDLKKNVINEILTEYDKYGYETKVIYTENGIINHRKSYFNKYVYDYKHNWIKKSQFRLNGQKKLILERKISYYE